MDKLESHKTAHSAFAMAMIHPIKKIKDIFSKVTLDGKLAKAIPWSKDKEVEEIKVVLESIDPGYDGNSCSWGQFKAKMAILYMFFKLHVCHYKYRTEIALCEQTDCAVCRKFGTGLRNPNSVIGRYTLLRPMVRPVNDPMNTGFLFSLQAKQLP